MCLVCDFLKLREMGVMIVLKASRDGCEEFFVYVSRTSRGARGYLQEN